MPKNKLNILGLYPGVGPKNLEVGVAVIKKNTLHRVETFRESSVVGWQHGFGRYGAQIIQDDEIDIVAWDSWGHRMVTRGGKPQQLIVKNPYQQEEFRNWLMLWCIQNNVKCLAFMAIKAKKAYTDDDLYFMHNDAGKNKHERDAIRHALFAQDTLKGRVQ